MEFTKGFQEIRKTDASIAGGKGASLGEMTQANIPVPPGFVILSSTFDHFIKETGLIEEIDAALEAVDHRVMHTVDAASEKIENLIKQQKFPDDIRVEVLQNFQELGAEFVAVRSSATAEDGAEHAWAGQLDTYLNTTEENLLENVKRCWASLFTPRAIFYRFEKELHKTKISVAVVVQKMVQSEKAGIAFSVHPVTEDYNQLIIEAGFGLGEAVVSGSVTPDSYVVSKKPTEIVDITVNTQNKALYGKPGGGNEWKDLAPEIASAQVLSREEIFELAKIIVEIEKHYGFPCDIEWAFEKGKFYITQSRPITTLAKKDAVIVGITSLIDRVKGMKWERWLERPFHAFTLSLFEDATRPESFEQIGVYGVELRTQLFQGDLWYLNNELLEQMDAQIEKHLLKSPITNITKSLEKFKEKSKKKIQTLVLNNVSIEEKFKETFDILKSACTYIWLAHGLESFYARRLRGEVPKYIETDTEKFIGDASFPKKKNEHVLLDEMMRGRTSDEKIAEKFGWLKSRDGFSEPYSAEDIHKMRQELPALQEHLSVDIPKPLRKLFTEVQELVFFRTARTDVFYELYFLARPIIK
ncbi:MAG: PEP/pyruvate-binding domain-containing protein, partial [bacterium]|nr:PEP/pyruvate-binding domain-containing protein [bacterium]